MIEINLIKRGSNYLFSLFINFKIKYHRRNFWKVKQTKTKVLNLTKCFKFGVYEYKYE